MSNPLETRPWFVDNLTKTIRGVYMAAYPRRGADVGYWKGAVSMVVAIIEALGGDPLNVITPEEILNNGIQNQ